MQKQTFHTRFPWLMALYFAGTWWVFRNDPFFGDAISSTARAATEIYNSHFSTVFYPVRFDPGHPTLYHLLLALVWKVLGMSLPVTHAFGIAFCVFMLTGFRRVCSLFLSKEQTNMATVLALVHPTVLSQHAMVLNTALVMGSFLWAVYFLLKQEYRWYTALLSIMMLSHLQGAFFLASLAMAHLFIHIRNGRSAAGFVKQHFYVYVLPFMVFCAWLLLHHSHAGFWVASPEYSDVSETNNLKQFIKGLAYCMWRFLDFGMIIPAGILAYLLFKVRAMNPLLAVTVITLLITSVIMSGILKNTIAHRYFLGFELLVLPCILMLLPQVKRPALLYGASLLALLAGNWQYIPGKIIADANVQYRHFFQLQDEMLNMANTFHAYGKAPIANPVALTHLLPGNDQSIERMGDTLDLLPCVITSNLCAEITPDMEKQLEGWYGKSLESGPVYVSVFLNPAVYPEPEGWHLRQPGGAELWMLKMKKRFK